MRVPIIRYVEYVIGYRKLDHEERKQIEVCQRFDYRGVNHNGMQKGWIICGLVRLLSELVEVFVADEGRFWWSAETSSEVHQNVAEMG